MMKRVPEKLIKERARKLPLQGSYVNPDWKEVGEANVLIVRRNPQGTYTFCMYVLDVWCLGLKEATYVFACPQQYLEQLMAEYSGVKVDYKTAHNIVYGAIAYAEDLGFKPHKDWKVAQYVLEADEDVEVEEFDFGDKGIPHYVAHPKEQQFAHNRILALLNKAVGEGNYQYTPAPQPIDEHAQLQIKNPFTQLSLTQKEFDEITLGEPQKKAESLFILSTSTYLAGREDEIEDCELDFDKITTALRFHTDESLFFCIDEELDQELIATLNEMTAENIYKEPIENLWAMKNNEPSNPFPYFALFQRVFFEDAEQGRYLIDEAADHIPDFIYLDILESFFSLTKNIPTDRKMCVERSHYITEAFPHRTMFTLYELIMFQALSALYFLHTDDVMSAVIASSVVAHYAPRTEYLRITMVKVAEAARLEEQIFKNLL